MSPVAAYNSRVPGGHPEGYLEAFANIYRNFAQALRATQNGEEPEPESLDFPSIEEGVRGMQFVETIVVASADDRKWVKMID